MAEESISIPQPLHVQVGGSAGQWQADCARTIFTNNDFSQERKSDENYAKDAIKKAQALWKALPDSWKEAITGEKIN